MNMSSYVRLVLRHRVAVLTLVAVVSAFAVVALGRATIGTSLGKLFLGETPAYATYLERIARFGSDEAVIVAVEDADLLAEATLDRLEDAVLRVEALADVDAVVSPHSAQRLRFTGGGLRATRLDDALRDALDDGPDAARQTLAAYRADPLAAALLASEDGRHAIVVVELVPDPDRPAERGPAIVADVLSAFTDAGFAAHQLHRAGFLAVMSEVMAQTEVSLTRVFPWCAAVLLVIVWLLFRRLWPVAIAMGVALVAVLWTMAFAILLDPQVSVMMAMVPAVVLIVAFSDIIHLVSAYLLELAAGHPKDDAIVLSAADVGTACVWTSATTFVGFVGMSFVPTPAFRLLGLTLGVGVAIALLLAVTLVPIAFSLMRAPKPWRAGATSDVQDGLDRLLARAARLATGRPRLVVAATAAVLAVTAFGLTRLHVETEFTQRLGEGNQVRRDADFFAAHFPRTHQLDLFVETAAPEGLFDPALLARLAAFQDAVAARPDVDAVTSVVDLVARVHHEIHEGDPAAGRLPDSREAIAQYVLLFEMAGGKGLTRLIDFDRRVARLSIRLADEGVRAAAVTGDAIATLSASHLGEAAAAVSVEPSGILYLIGSWLDEVLAGQQRGLGFTFAVIALMMVVALRSLRVGLWSMLPNALPVLVLGAWLGLTRDRVDSDHLALAMLAIGIGVDDTIHFLVRYRLEAARCAPDAAGRAEALRRAYDFAGRAIVMTTVVLGAGFAPMALSDYGSTQMFGTLLPMTLVVALLADLLLVPAMAQLGWLRFPASAQDRAPADRASRAA